MQTVIQTTLLSALKAFLAGEKYTAEPNIDWEALYRESVSQAVVSSCLQGLNEEQIPPEILSQWQSVATRVVYSAANVHAQHAELDDMMTAANLPYVILKGSASAYYYPDPFMRAMGDVDFLLSEEDIERGKALLIEKGFTVFEMPHDVHIVFRKEKMHLEMHRRPAGVPEGEMGKKIQAELSDIFEKSERVELDGNRFLKPSDFHHGLIILMHTYHHLLSEGIGLRHLCDWAAFINRFENDGFAQLFEEKLSNVGLWRFAQILSYICHRYLGVTYRDFMGEVDEILCEEVLLDIFAGGNFGEKDENRAVQGLAISSRGENGVGKKGKFAQILRSANQAAKLRYHRMAKIPILRHFCIIPLGFRYLFRVLTGKKKRLKIAQNMKQAERRKHIYQQFHLFETGEKQ